MLPLDFISLAQQCAPQVSLSTMAAIVRTESGFNPYAIGVVHGRLERQPTNEAEAVATAQALETGGWNFSVGLAQVNHTNWPAYGLSERSAFDPCRNLAAGAAILQGCFELAKRTHMSVPVDSQSTLRASLSCYGSGDFSTGFRTGYVQRVLGNVRTATPQSSIPVAVPAISPIRVISTPDISVRPGQPRLPRQPVPQAVDASSGNFDREPDGSAVVF